jgi:hypothetical protein
MSMNIYFEASREVRVLSTGRNAVQKVQIHDVWQTPTDISYKICESADPIQEYFDWVMSVSEEQTIPVYADDDVFCEREPIGSKTYHPGKEHIEDLKKYFNALIKEGYEVRPVLI